jgi:hypothetical protein
MDDSFSISIIFPSTLQFDIQYYVFQDTNLNSEYLNQ